MRLIVPLLIGAAVLAAAISVSMVSKKTPTISADIVKQYSEWRQKFGKLYATPAEFNHRLRTFQSQVEFIRKANIDYENAIGHHLDEPMFGVNEFSDMSDEEFTAQMTGVKMDSEVIEDTLPEQSASPVALGQSSFSLKIRNQGSCGSCWAFSALAAYEKLHHMKTGQRLDFSHQQLVDCDTGSNGCSGGWPHSALNYISQRGISLSTSYPYKAAKGTCKPVGTQYRTSFRVAKGSWTSSANSQAISAGHHTSVLLYATGKFRSLRGTGVFDASVSGECNQRMNHAVNAIGTSSGAFSILNSWGTSWGSNGVMKIKPCSSSNLYGQSNILVYGA